MKDATEIYNDYIKANEFITDFKSKQTSIIQKIKSDFDGIICALENRRDSFETDIKKHINEFDISTKKQRKVLDDLADKYKKGKTPKKLEDANECLKSYLEDVSKIGLFYKEVDEAINRFTVGFDLYFQSGVPPSRMLAESEAPKGWMEQKDPSSGFTFFYNIKDTKAQWEFPADTPLPSGWAELKDVSSGKSYYHNKIRSFSQWKRPTNADSEPNHVVNVVAPSTPSVATAATTTTVSSGSSTPLFTPSPLQSSITPSSPLVPKGKSEWRKSVFSGKSQQTNFLQKSTPMPSYSQPSAPTTSTSPNNLSSGSSPSLQQQQVLQPQVQQQQQQVLQPQIQQQQQQQIRQPQTQPQQPIHIQPQLIPDTHFVRNNVQLPSEWGWYTYNKVFYYRNFVTKETRTLRPGWTKMVDQSKNRVYYGHNVAKITQWDPPEWYDESTHRTSPINVFTGEKKMDA